MKTVAFDNTKIEDYVYNRLRGNAIDDFEADMALDADLQKEVARSVLKKLIQERKEREQLAAQKNKEKELFLDERLIVIEEKEAKKGIKYWWKQLIQRWSFF